MSLHVTNLQCLRQERLLFSDLNFSLAPGEMLYVSGINGAGKTSLLRILAGLIAPQAGAIHWQSETIATQSEHYRKNISYIGHKTGIKLALTVTENLQLTPDITNRKNNFAELLQQFSLTDYQDVLAQKLSAGQRQRLALINLLNSTRPLWILDEPLTALDSDAIKQLQNNLTLHLHNGGMVILTSHQLLPFSYTHTLEL